MSRELQQSRYSGNCNKETDENCNGPEVILYIIGGTLAVVALVMLALYVHLCGGAPSCCPRRSTARRAAGDALAAGLRARGV